MMCRESKSLQQAACFCVPGMRSTADVDPWLEVIFANADDATHANLSDDCRIATAILPPVIFAVCG